MRVIASIQARYCSTRLPGKVCKPIGGYPLLYHIYRRVSACTRLSGVIVAIGDKEPAPVVAVCDHYKMPSFVGSEDDLLQRHIKAAEPTYADAILRATGDCIWHDPALLWDMVSLYIEKSPKINGLSNWPLRLHSEGVDAEIWSVPLLRELNGNPQCPKEGFAAWVLNSPERCQAYRVAQIGDSRAPGNKHPHMSIDTQEDFDKAEKVLKMLKPDDFNYASTVRAYNEK